VGREIPGSGFVNQLASLMLTKGNERQEEVRKLLREYFRSDLLQRC
jgi:hypothetical protein